MIEQHETNKYVKNTKLHNNKKNWIQTNKNTPHKQNTPKKNKNPQNK